MSDENERSDAMRGSHGDAVHSAALALYEAGCWISADVPREKADAMWATLRDALRLLPGHATARGADGMSELIPPMMPEELDALIQTMERVQQLEAEVAKLRLTDAEREAIQWAATFVDENYAVGAGNALRALLKRLT